MNRKAAWAIEPFPTAVTDVLARLIAVTVFRVYWTGCFQWKRPASGTWTPYVMRGGNGNGRRPRLLFRGVSVSLVHSVENELGGDGPRARSLIITAWFDEIYKTRLIPTKHEHERLPTREHGVLTWEEVAKAWERGVRHGGVG